MDADDVRVKQAAERIRELSGDVADVLSGGLSFDTFTYRGSLLHDLLDAALVLQKHYLADAGRAADKTACEACGGRGFTSVATGWCDSCEGTGYAGRAADGEPGVADGATFAERYGVGQAKDHYNTLDLITAFEAGKACQRRAAGGEAVTEEWLRSVGFLPDGTDESKTLALTLHYGRTPDGWENGTDVGRHLLIDPAGDTLIEEYDPGGKVLGAVSLPTVKTRGDVRRLLAALGGGAGRGT